MLFELVKNSLRAVQERFEDASHECPPIRVVVADGIEDVTIKVCIPFTTNSKQLRDLRIPVVGVCGVRAWSFSSDLCIEWCSVQSLNWLHD